MYDRQGMFSGCNNWIGPTIGGRHGDYAVSVSSTYTLLEYYKENVKLGSDVTWCSNAFDLDAWVMVDLWGFYQVSIGGDCGGGWG